MNKAIEQLELLKVLEQVGRHTSFSLGKEKVMNLRPRSGRLIIERELNRSKEAMVWLQHNLPISFGGISDISEPLTYLQKGGVLSESEIVDVGRFLHGSINIVRSFNKGEGEYPYLQDLIDSIYVQESLLQYIQHAFSEKGEILDRASTTLKELREEYRNTEKNIDKQTQEFLRKHSDSLVEQVVTLYQGRRSFLIKVSDKNKLKGTVLGMSSSGISAYFEPSTIGDLQNKLLDISNKIKHEEERICIETSQQIRKDVDQIMANLDTVALLDMEFAKGAFGIETESCIPILTNDTLELVKARHPLIDPKKIVANNYNLHNPYKMILISGPNTGGKSVSLKTIGISVLMTLTGLPVLAESAKVMFVDNVFVDIGDSQSIEKSLSSFSAHIETINEVIMDATSNSLVLLDELGSQTDPLEGESLSMAILDYFREVGCYVVATTHFSKLKQYGSTKEDILMASLEFDLNTLSPTYRYREHLIGESNAFAISKRLNLKQSIIDNAVSYKQESQYEIDHMMDILEEKIAQTQALEDTLKLQQDQLKQREIELSNLKKQLEQDFIQKEKELETKYEKSLEQLVEEAKQQLEIINKETRPDFRKKAVDTLTQKQKEVSIDGKIEVGSRVRLKSTRQVGIVQSIERKDAFVLIGTMTIKTPLNKLELLEAQVKPTVQRKNIKVSTISKPKMELNLIGKRALDAQIELEKYLDNCVVAKIPICRIIHGHGSGALRKMVHEVLRRNKHIASFELAQVNEGGTGATVVKFKTV